MCTKSPFFWYSVFFFLKICYNNYCFHCRYGTGKVIVRSHGVWYTKCYPSKVHTKSDLEAICRQLGFISGHAKQLPMPDKLITIPHNKYVIDNFNEIVFNNRTKIKLRNTNAPIARAVIGDFEECNPVFIECL